MFDDYNNAVDELHDAIVSHCFREGFKAGAKMQLEILGYERNKNNSGNKKKK